MNVDRTIELPGQRIESAEQLFQHRVHMAGDFRVGPKPARWFQQYFVLGQEPVAERTEEYYVELIGSEFSDTISQHRLNALVDQRGLDADPRLRARTEQSGYGFEFQAIADEEDSLLLDRCLGQERRNLIQIRGE